MTATASTSPTASACFRESLMAYWLRNRHDYPMRAIGRIVQDAREGKLPGVEPMESGFGFRVTDEAALLAAMTREG